MTTTGLTHGARQPMSDETESETVWLVQRGTVGEAIEPEEVRETAASARTCARDLVPNDADSLINRVGESLTITWDDHSKIVKTVEVPYEQ